MKKMSTVILYRFLSMTNIVFGHILSLVFISKLSSKSTIPFIAYFCLESVGTIMLSQLFSLVATSKRSFKIIHIISLIVYNLLGVTANCYMYTEMIRTIRTKYIWKETVEYDADYDLFYPLLDELRMMGFFCVVPMIQSFGNVVHNHVSHGDGGKWSLVETFAYWIGSISVIYVCLYHYTSIYVSFYQISVIWFGLSVLTLLIGVLQCILVETPQDEVVAEEFIEEEEDGNLEMNVMMKLFLFRKSSNSNNIAVIYQTLRNWADLFFNCRIFENESVMLLFALQLDFSPEFIVFFVIMRGMALLNIKKKDDSSFWILHYSYHTRTSKRVTFSYVMYQGLSLFLIFILTLLNSMPFFYLGNQKVVNSKSEQVVFGLSMLLPTFLSQIENILFSEEDQLDKIYFEEKEHKLVVILKRYLPLFLQLVVIGSMTFLFNDPGLFAFKFYSDVSLLLQLAGFGCLLVSYIFSCFNIETIKEKQE